MLVMGLRLTSAELAREMLDAWFATGPDPSEAANIARLDDTLIERLCLQHEAAPGPQCEMHIHQMGGAVASIGDQDTAFPERSMPYVLDQDGHFELQPLDDVLKRAGMHPAGR